MRILISGLMILAAVAGRADSQTMNGSKGVPSFSGPSAIAVKAVNGPTIEAASIGVRPSVSSDVAASPQRRSRRSRPDYSVVLMIVGGAAMVAGAAIDGDAGTIFMVGGAVIALWGLYNFLQ